MSNSPKISIVLATYSGIDLIDKCLTSIRNQKYPGADMELVVVVDGPNYKLRDLIESYRAEFQEKSIRFIVHMFEENKGRFAAQRKSAELASGEWILMMGDRISLPPDYISQVFEVGEEVVIPDVTEIGWEKNIINIFMHQIRQKVFTRAGKTECKQYLTKSNFESSPKGNGGMLIKKRVYLKACEEMNVEDSNKHISDDTSMLRALVDREMTICRSLNIKILYEPRTSFKQQIRHIYERGPRFVDYYIRPGTRFHKFLLILLFLPLVISVTVVASRNFLPLVFAIMLSSVVLFSALLASRLSQFLRLLLAVPVVGIVFLLGVYRGFGIFLISSRHFRLKKYLSIILLIASVFIFVFYVKGHQEEFALLGKIEFKYTIFIFVANVLSLFINGAFMKIILEPLGKDISLKDSFYVSLLSSVGNFFAPGGTGIGIRGVYLKKKHQVKYSDFINTVAGNYVIAFLVISLGGLASLILIGRQESSSYEVLFFIFLCLFFADIALMQKRVSRIIKLLLLRIKWKIPGLKIVISIFEGWELLTSNRKVLAKLIMLALTGYLVSFSTTFFILQSLQIHISLAGILLLVALSSLSIFINITPGNIGIKEAVLVSSAQLIGLSTAQTLSYAIVDRIVLFSVLFVAWVLLQTMRSTKKLKELV